MTTWPHTRRSCMQSRLQRLPGAYIPSETASKNKMRIELKSPALQFGIIMHLYSCKTQSGNLWKAYSDLRGISYTVCESEDSWAMATPAGFVLGWGLSLIHLSESLFVFNLNKYLGAPTAEELLLSCSSPHIKFLLPEIAVAVAMDWRPGSAGGKSRCF